MTENKWILNKLMSDNPDSFDSLGDSNTPENEKLMTASRIVQVRYRFYAVWVLLAILLIIFWMIMPWLDTFNAKKSQIASAKRTLEWLQAREDTYKQSIGFLETVQEEDLNIVNCINEWENCQNLPQEILDGSWLARTYLLTNWMNETKMDVDERKIIESVDRYLVKLEPFLNNSSVNWTLNRISIWDKSSDGKLYTVPVWLDMTFEDKESLLSFINNIEKYIPSEETLRIFYKINSINYDVINSDQPQDTTIYMDLYYYDE